MPMNNLKSQQFSNNLSSNTVPNDKMPSNLEPDDQLYPALTLDLYSIPANAVSTFNASVHQIQASCHIA